MMPVASYDNYDENGDEYDYYKCKYCRYVAPFTSLVKQDYLYESINNTYHNVKCNIDEDGDNETDYSIDWFNENHYSNYETNTPIRKVGISLSNNSLDQAKIQPVLMSLRI